VHTQLWLYLGGSGLIGIGIQYFLFFWACPAQLRKAAAKNLDLKFSLFAILGLMAFLGFLFLGLNLFNDLTENDKMALTGPWLANGGVMFWGLIRCTKLRENYKKEHWQKQVVSGGTTPSAGTKGRSSATVPSGKTQPCPRCFAAVSVQSPICKNCGYPIVESPVPRRVKLRLNLNTLLMYSKVIGYS
jgi:hypothetical protein